MRYIHFGEGDDDKTEAAIRSLLAEAGAERLGGDAASARPRPSAAATPETYLGSARAEGWVPGRRGTARTTTTRRRAAADEPLRARRAWRVDAESAEAVRDARFDANVVGKGVYLVLSSRGGTPRQVGVELDGRPIRAADAGADVHGGRVTVRRQRLYRLVELGEHRAAPADAALRAPASRATRSRSARGTSSRARAVMVGQCPVATVGPCAQSP